MKKFLIIIAAFIFSVIANELVVRFIIGYPVYGIEKSIAGIPYPGQELLYKPYSKYWSVEGGNKVYARNNIGLQGNNVIVSDTSKYIFVLGNSFIKGAEFEQSKIATSVFQNLLNPKYSKYQVINLGFYAHDPYQLWFIAKFFERTYPPAYVILFIDRDFREWLENHEHPLKFSIPDNFGNEVSSSSFKLSKTARNSSLIHLLASALKYSSAEFPAPMDSAKWDEIRELIPSGAKTPCDDLKACIGEYKKTFGNKFILISGIPDEDWNKNMNLYCSESKVNFEYDSKIMFSVNRIIGGGHFSEPGNKNLGEILFKAFEKNAEK